MHAADFHQGIRGDLHAASEMLTKVLAVTPGNQDAFNRLETARREISTNVRAAPRDGSH